MADELKTMAEAKANPAGGVKFLATTGAVGTILSEKGGDNKWKAELTCTYVDSATGKCQLMHIRSMSDWHQCGKCQAHAKKKTPAGGIKVKKEPKPVTEQPREVTGIPTTSTITSEALNQAAQAMVEAKAVAAEAVPPESDKPSMSDEEVAASQAALKSRLAERRAELQNKLSEAQRIGGPIGVMAAKSIQTDIDALGE